MTAKVFLSGEGSSDLGNRDYPDGTRVGVLEALLRKIEPNGWDVGGAVRWINIKKFAARKAIQEKGHGDIRNVVALTLQAVEAECDVVAFSRDVDAEREERANAIATGILRAREKFPMIEIIGGAAFPAIEGWLLALLGVRGTEAMSRAKANALLAKRDLSDKKPEDYCTVVDEADLDAIAPDCTELRKWIDTARAVLGTAIRGA